MIMQVSVTEINVHELSFAACDECLSAQEPEITTLKSP